MKRLILFAALYLYSFAAFAQVTCAKDAGVQAALYATGDQMGELMNFSQCLGASRGSCFIQDVLISDAAAQVADADLILFKQSPTLASSDNAAFSIADASLPYIMAVVPIRTHYTLTGNSVSTAHGLSIAVDSTNAKDLYGVLVARSGPTFAAITDVTVTISCVTF